MYMQGSQVRRPPETLELGGPGAQSKQLVNFRDNFVGTLVASAAAEEGLSRRRLSPSET